MSKQLVDQDQLIKLAGKECYQRGLVAFETLNLENFQSTDDRLEADVDGYHVKLRFNGDMVEGNCTCPVSDGFDFCQHCVQLSLYSNKRVKQLMSLSKGPDKSKIFAYLVEQEKQALAKQILEFLERDAQQFDRYLLKASLASETLDVSELRQRITELTKLADKHGLFSQRQVKIFFYRMELFFEELANVDLSRQHEAALKLIEYAVLRVNQVLDSVDDKWGYREPVFVSIERCFIRLFALLKGRDLTLVKRFEKLFFVDRHQILGATPQPYLSSNKPLLTLFNRRMQWVWSKHTHIEISRVTQDDRLLSALPVLDHGWQWRKLAVYLSKSDAPETNDRFAWTRSIREHLLQGPEAWLTWIDEVEQEFGRDAARQCALDALQHFPAHGRLIHKCADLVVSGPLAEGTLKTLVDANPLAVLGWLQELETDLQSRLSKQLSAPLFDAIKKMEPRDEFDDPLARGCDAFLQWLARYPSPDVERMMVCDARVPAGIRMQLARRFDDSDPATAMKARESLIPYLLGKNQNKTDRLAAEQTVLLKRNLSSLGLGDDTLEGILIKFESLIRKRSNFVKLVQQYSQKEVSLKD